MFKIAHDKKITMVQGDTGVIRMKISNHELSQGDEVRFAIVNKANSSMLLCQHSDKKIVLEKQVTVFEKDGTARIVIYPYDTENLQPGKYLYEIQVKTKDGRIDTVVPLVSFTLMEGYIQGEYGQTTPSTPEPTPSEIEVRFKRLENEIIPELGTRVTNVENEIDSISSSLDNITNRIVNLENNGTVGGGLDLDDVIEGEVFTSVIQTYPCESLTLSKSTLSFNNLSSQIITTTVTPNNCTDKVTWSVSPSGVVNVSNGVVTPIKNGNCVITATCGDKTKTCSVNVNVSYSITNNLTNVTSDNSTTSYALGSSYSATLTPKSNYILSAVTVTMGGSDITASVNNNGVINISNVTGNIVITANAVEKIDITYSITNNLTNVINSNSVTTVNEKTSYSATLTANEGYNLSTVTVIMGGFDITSSVYSEGNINISSVTGDVIINATADAVVIASELKATTEIIDDKTYLVVDDILSIRGSNFNNSAFVPTSYKDKNYQLYSLNTLSFKTIWNMTNGSPFGDTIPYLSVNSSVELMNNTATGDLCCFLSSSIQIRLPLDLNGYSTVEEYLENKYEKLKFALIDTFNTKVIDPSKITSMTLKTNNYGFQYAQFGYSDLPTSNIYNGVNSLFVTTATNANLSDSVIPTACISTTTLSICFKAGTFEQFTLDNVKNYLTENPLVFWYK